MKKGKTSTAKTIKKSKRTSEEGKSTNAHELAK
jgi:hypothetical protein